MSFALLGGMLVGGEPKSKPKPSAPPPRRDVRKGG
jgi:hypothetical protein